MMELRPRPQNPIANGFNSTQATPDAGLSDLERVIAQLITDDSDFLPDHLSGDFVGMADLMLPISEPLASNVEAVPDPIIEELTSPELDGLPLTQYAVWRLAHSADDHSVGRGLIALGMACSQNDLYPLAHYYCAIAADVFRGLRSQTDEADALYHAGLAAYQCDCGETAILLLERARVLNLVTNRVAEEARTLLKLGEVYTQMDQGKAALCCLLDSWALYSDLGDYLGEMLTLVRLGWIYETEDMPLSALDSYRQAIALYPMSIPFLSSEFPTRFPTDVLTNIPTNVLTNISPKSSPIVHAGGRSSRILSELMLKMAEVLYQAGELNEALTCYRQVVWCNNQ
ncbi:MAG: tetratricopeptide repeat protein [Cyanothece sp. SIO2G6]|nr:tetratricopeptide repeat protein [Cyanothece sp. SIO2G6]